MTRVLIVAKTHLWQHVCIGALSRNPPQHLRLLHEHGEKLSETDGYEVGQVWEIEFQRLERVEPPHVEDVRVIRRQLEQTLTSPQTRDAIIRHVTPTRDLRRLLQNTLNFPPGIMQSAYVARERIPDHSTEFWETDQLLTYSQNAKGQPYYRYQSAGLDLKIRYVGFPAPVQQIPAGSLLRMSLARWWNQEGKTDPRCYLQLSGWWLSP